MYGNVNILLQEVRQIDTFDDNPDAVVQLPQTTERELRTQVRVRPGDSILIAGLVKENDNIDRSGPGINEPIIPTSRVAQSLNSELVFLLRPRVVVFTSADGPGLRAAPPAVAEIMSKPNPLIPLPSELPAAQPKKEVRLDPPARPDAPVTTPPDSVDLSSVVEDVPAPAIEAEELEAQPMVKETPLAEKSARSSSSVEVSPLFDAAPKAQLPSSSPIKAKEKRASGDPSVIVNYDVLGQ